MAGERVDWTWTATCWRRGVRRAPLLRLIDLVLRGSGQVVFMNNPLTGLLNFAALGWAAWAGGTTWAVALGAVLGALVATVAAAWRRADRGTLRAGLYGFNGMLVGVALPTFVAASPGVWLLLVASAALSVWVTVGVARWLGSLRVPGLTFPFIVMTWLALLAAQHGLALQTAAAPPAALAASAPGWVDAARAVLVGVAQVFFVDDAVAGAIFLLALAAHTPTAALLAASGAALGAVGGLLTGADTAAIVHGQWGYAPALTAIAVGCAYLRTSFVVLLHAAAATAVTVALQGALMVLMPAIGLPPLTFAFVLGTWGCLLVRRRVGFVVDDAQCAS